MKVNIKVISSFENSFYIKVEDTITVKELKEKISQKIKNNKFNLIRDGGILHDSIDLNTYEFCEFDYALIYESIYADESGYIDTDKNEKTYKLTQEYIKRNVSRKVADMCFNLTLPNGPFFCKYSKNKTKYFLEENIKDKIYDAIYLHNEDFIALAQEKNVFIYNKQGVEIHAVGENNNYQDTTNGKIVSSIYIKDKNIIKLNQNSSTAIIYTGHSNGVVSLWSPNSKNYISKVLCHATSVLNLEIDRAGRYMYTTGIDQYTKVWDIRNTYKPVNNIKNKKTFNTTALSQKSMFAAANGDKIRVYKNLSMSNAKDLLYLEHREMGSPISSLNFKNFEDILTVGHLNGISNLIIPGKKEVKMLLDKIPYTFIGKNILVLNENTKEKDELRVKKELNVEKDNLRNVLSKYLKK
ncbi:wd repeat-containing protein 46 [Vairimorpha apis BRL 01]|uniref:Wd repeat-containing protein 46 n=1 Tax=Vairimorpha apis BRL 01 TaxID=1037528 RepID=T0MML7_9MICR|nr:wd repeat-containing protein 46 [Vairimorpha apis BRL 01]